MLLAQRAPSLFSHTRCSMRCAACREQMYIKGAAGAARAQPILAGALLDALRCVQGNDLGLGCCWCSALSACSRRRAA